MDELKGIGLAAQGVIPSTVRALILRYIEEKAAGNKREAARQLGTTHQRLDALIDNGERVYDTLQLVEKIRKKLKLSLKEADDLMKLGFEGKD